MLILDLLGGDLGPEALLEGAVEYLRAPDADKLLLVGPGRLTEACLERAGVAARAEILDAEETMRGDEPPQAIFGGRDETSLAKALGALKARQDCGGLLTAGSTGALLVGSICRLGLQPGLRAPVLASWLPAGGDRWVCLADCGANIECSAKDMVRFAQLGSAFASQMRPGTKPRVGLLNVGREKGKGTKLLREAYALLEESGLDFIGNVEGSDLFSGRADVICADGVSGNILLKSTEAAGQAAAEAAGALGAPEEVASALRESFNLNARGGATLLGTVKPVVKMHGRATARTVVSCLRQLEHLREGGKAP